MKLVNVTNSHSRLVLNQLENTDAHMVKVYTAGNTTVVYTEAPEHNEILLINENRNVRPQEIEEIKNYFLNKIHDADYHEDEIKIIELAGLVEISIPKHNTKAEVAM
ncbi:MULTISPECIES: DUF1827 family protein [unclassified Enterococcus]|uniref:DUF1827 family protein n=1 Tax=unclassified Enterococcus TaxID=2608891 RepID=UPI0013EE0AD9|nr:MULTISPECIES: DUF1827 family protein [unclassified Enterococcus]